MIFAAMATIFASGTIAPMVANGQVAVGTCGVARTAVSREAISTDTSYPGARPFNGPRALVFEVRPAVSGTARLTLSSGSTGNASLGHMDIFDGAVSNGSAVGTDPSRATLVYKTSCLHVIKFHH